MNYEFPIITHISDVLPAIDGRDEFVVAEKEGYTVINYNVMFEDTFPAITESGANSDAVAALRRELRGIIFDQKTGALIRRPFHKFFNVNEREETQDHSIDMSAPHVIFEKLDGSMIAPFIVDGKVIWGTKMGATQVAEPVEAFVAKRPYYEEFARECIERGVTPIFEWCSRKQRIVLDYPEDRLVLTAMRQLELGGYFLYEAMETIAGRYPQIPLVRIFKPTEDLRQFSEYTRDLEDTEGFVIRFHDGHMLKLKSHWYLQIHKAKEAILQDRNIVELILEEHLDDIKAHLAVEDRDRLSRFEHDINKAINERARLIAGLLSTLRFDQIDRKTFALEYADKCNAFSRPIVFKNYDADIDVARIENDVRNTIRNNLGRTVKYEAIRDAWFPGVIFNGANEEILVDS